MAKGKQAKIIHIITIEKLDDKYFKIFFDKYPVYAMCDQACVNRYLTLLEYGDFEYEVHYE